MFKFSKKKKRFADKLQIGLELKRCAECDRNSRPCLADGAPALFHRWVDGDRALLKINAFVRPAEQDALVRAFRAESVVSPSCSTELVRETFALVEYPDGSVGKVKPELVTFLDKEVAE